MKWIYLFVVVVVFTIAASAVGPAAASQMQQGEAKQQQQSIFDIAASDGRFTTLVAALEAAGLAETLKGEGRYTVFAPTDDAFAKLPEGTVESLLLPENQEMLQSILLYHAVDGKLTAEDVVQRNRLMTLNGEKVKISVDGDTVKINDATVVITDIKASNGVIHVIDSVLVP